MIRSRYGIIAVAMALWCAVITLIRITVIDNYEGSTNSGAIIYDSNSYSVESQFVALPYPSERKRKLCQIVYVLGVEGTKHHGIEPIIESLAKSQIDQNSGLPYDVQIGSDNLRYGLFGYPQGKFGFLEPPSIDDPRLVQEVISSICPDDGKHHVIIESNSFPSGGKHHATSRVRRQIAWHQMTPEGISNSFAALNHPTNLYQFYDAYHRYADIKFVVLDRPFLETIASHKNFDSGPRKHANIVHGYLILLGRFLNSYRIDEVTGEKVWTMIGVNKISANYHEDESKLDQARKDVINQMALLLGWPQMECPNCFSSWVDSTSDYGALLGNFNVKRLTEQMQNLEGIWPPHET
jgi:hypothetical protein